MIQPSYHLLPGDLPEDIRQEMAMAEYTGRKTSMKRLYDVKAVGYGLRPAENAIPVWSVVKRPDYSTIERLTNFVFTQSEGIKQEILAYLHEPDEERLAGVLKALGVTKILVADPAPVTLTDMILKVLPATQEDLYKLAHSVHTSRKPEAAVRQNIRNLLRQRRVVWEGDLLCRAGDSASRTRKSSESVAG